MCILDSWYVFLELYNCKQSFNPLKVYMKPPSSEKLPFNFHYMKNSQAWQTNADGNRDKEKKLAPSQNLHVHTIPWSVYMLNKSGRKPGQGKKN